MTPIPPMKTIFRTFRTCGVITAIVAFPLTHGFSQSEATTDPVGIIELSVPAGGSVNSPKIALISPTLTQPIKWQGTISAVSSSTQGLITTTTITVDGVQWAANDFNGANGSHYVEIVSTAIPAHSGALAQITATAVASTTSSITTEDLRTFAGVGDTIRIRKDVTIADIFGATNSAGLLASDDPTTGDEVYVYDGSSSAAYFYFTGAPPTYPAGWYDSAFQLAPGTAEKVVIGPHQGVVIKRKAAAGISIAFAGSVKKGNTLFPVVSGANGAVGVNVLGTVSARGFTLNDSGLYTGNPATGVKPSDDPTTADELIIYTANSQTSYFYYNGGQGYASGWYDSAFSTTSPIGAAVTIAPGSAFVLKRKGGVNFNWALPSPTSF